MDINLKKYGTQLLCVVAMVTVAFAVTCQDGATAQGDFCFIGSRGDVQWWEANNMCQAYGCEVVYPNDATELAALQAYGSSISYVCSWKSDDKYKFQDKSRTDIKCPIGKKAMTTQYWVGLIDLLSKGNWVDTSTGEQQFNISWSSGRPSGSSNENCASVFNTNVELLDESCGSQRKFICECPSI